MTTRYFESMNTLECNHVGMTWKLIIEWF